MNQRIIIIEGFDNTGKTYNSSLLTANHVNTAYISTSVPDECEYDFEDYCKQLNHFYSFQTLAEYLDDGTYNNLIVDRWLFSTYAYAYAKDKIKLADVTTHYLALKDEMDEVCSAYLAHFDTKLDYKIIHLELRDRQASTMQWEVNNAYHEMKSIFKDNIYSFTFNSGVALDYLWSILTPIIESEVLLSE